MKGINEVGFEVDSDQFLADVKAKVETKVMFTFLTTTVAPGYYFEEHREDIEVHDGKLLSEVIGGEIGGPGFLINCGRMDDYGFEIGDTSEFTDDYFRKYFYVKEGSREYLDRVKDEVKDFFQLGYGQEQAIMEHLYPSKD